MRGNVFVYPNKFNRSSGEGLQQTIVLADWGDVTNPVMNTNERTVRRQMKDLAIKPWVRGSGLDAKNLNTKIIDKDSGSYNLC